MERGKIRRAEREGKVTAYNRRIEAVERVALRRWLRRKGVKPVMGCEPLHTERLMKQVMAARGDPFRLMSEARRVFYAVESAERRRMGLPA